MDSSTGVNISIFSSYFLLVFEALKYLLDFEIGLSRYLLECNPSQCRTVAGTKSTYRINNLETVAAKYEKNGRGMDPHAIRLHVTFWRAVRKLRNNLEYNWWRLKAFRSSFKQIYFFNLEDFSNSMKANILGLS